MLATKSEESRPEAAKIPAALEYEMFESRDCPGEWHVDAIDFANEGLVYAAIFTGSLARERAERYAAWVRGEAPAS